MNILWVYCGNWSRTWMYNGVKKFMIFFRTLMQFYIRIVASWNECLFWRPILSLRTGMVLLKQAFILIGYNWRTSVIETRMCYALILVLVWLLIRESAPADQGCILCIEAPKWQTRTVTVHLMICFGQCLLTLIGVYHRTCIKIHVSTLGRWPMI